VLAVLAQWGARLSLPDLHRRILGSRHRRSLAKRFNYAALDEQEELGVELQAKRSRPESNRFVSEMHRAMPPAAVAPDSWPLPEPHFRGTSLECTPPERVVSEE